MSIDSRHILGYLEGIVDAIVWKVWSHRSLNQALNDSTNMTTSI